MSDAWNHCISRSCICAPARYAIAKPFPHCSRVAVERVVQFRYSNVLAGEKRSELEIVPPFNVRVDPDIAVFPVSESVASAPLENSVASDFRRKINVTVGNNEKAAADVNVTLSAPAGWRIEPARFPCPSSLRSQ